jgi:hypothetical protein
MKEKILRASRVAVRSAAALALVVMAFLLRRRGAQLRSARVETLEAKHAGANEKSETAIAALEAKVEASEKDALRKTHLLRDLLDPGDGAGPSR